MPLPYPDKVVLPFDIATAQDMNERHANDVALAEGTGFNNGAIDTPQIADSAVTPEKRSGGFAFKILDVSSTGSKQAVDIGFTPKFALFLATIASSNASGVTTIVGYDGDSAVGLSMSTRPAASNSASSRLRGGQGNKLVGLLQHSSSGGVEEGAIFEAGAFGDGTFSYNVTSPSGAWSVVAWFMG